MWGLYVSEKEKNDVHMPASSFSFLFSFFLFLFFPLFRSSHRAAAAVGGQSRQSGVLIVHLIHLMF